MPGLEPDYDVISPQVRELLEARYELFNCLDFIPLDPVSIPHGFSKKQDIEIAGFFAAILAWGQRKTIISKCQQLMHLMSDAPYDFIKNHSESDLKSLLNFKHRTFNSTDLLYFVHFLNGHYQEFDSLEDAFLPEGFDQNDTIESNLIHFHDYFCDSPHFPARTRKHLATPARRSTCKRLNMYLRWMVRSDQSGVDFGLWKRISPAQLVCPCDVHVERVGRLLGLIKRPVSDWGMALELTKVLRKLDPQDPVKYDFALFGIGVMADEAIKSPGPLLDSVRG